MDKLLFLTATSSLILLAGVVTDLRSKKVPNKLILTCIAVALCAQFYAYGFNGYITAGLAFMAAFAFYTPFVAIRAIGAGDMKLMLAFSIVNNWQTVISVSIFALIWGALLGVIRSTLNGGLIDLLKNTLTIIKPSTYENKKNNISIEGKSNLHSIPYTVALLFGWMSHLAYNKGGL